MNLLSLIPNIMLLIGEKRRIHQILQIPTTTMDTMIHPQGKRRRISRVDQQKKKIHQPEKRKKISVVQNQRKIHHLQVQVKHKRNLQLQNKKKVQAQKRKKVLNLLLQHQETLKAIQKMTQIPVNQILQQKEKEVQVLKKGKS